MGIGSCRKRTLAVLLEILAVISAYIVIAVWVAGNFELSGALPDQFSQEERLVGATFLAGALVQIGLVLFACYVWRQRDFREGLAAIGKPASTQAWFVALAAAFIHIMFGTMFFVPDASRLAEPSLLNLTLSIIPAPDGWSQEIVFRGYILYRLTRAGIAPRVQILASGVAFAGIHLGYAGVGWAAFWPLFGTFILGSLLAWSVKLGNMSLKPAVVAHILIIIALQPWLALAR